MTPSYLPSLFADHSPTTTVYRVMIVEDHEDTRSMLRTILESLNFEVIEAIDGETAFQIDI